MLVKIAPNVRALTQAGIFVLSARLQMLIKDEEF